MRCYDCGSANSVTLAICDELLCPECEEKRFPGTMRRRQERKLGKQKQNSVVNLNHQQSNRPDESTGADDSSTKICDTSKNKRGESSSSKDVLIVNELLCFLVNKMDVMPTDILSKVCCDFYEDSQIENSKKELFDLCSSATSTRFRRRQGQNKKLNNVQDILNLLHEVDPEVIPSFVAVDLGNLPPITQNHIDISVLMQQMSSIKSDITSLKECTKHSLQLNSHLEDEIELLKNSQSYALNGVNCISEVNDKSVACHSEIDENRPQPVACVEQEIISVLNAPTPHKQQEENTKVMELFNSGSPRKTVSPTKSYAKALKCIPPQPSAGQIYDQTSVHENSSITDSSKVDSFKLVTRKKRQKRSPVIGTSLISDCVVHGINTEPTVHIFVSRLGPDTSSTQLTDYIKKTFHCISVIECEQLSTKYDSYSSFRITVKGVAYSDIVCSEKWPCGVLVRKFYRSRSKKASTEQ
ncbi:uncharacterized protein [Ptychodera flava]|uniref:uncharacterized protein n=1 Tax=Ptychodera flava TaxID=63121 RepID=UPI003969C97C